MKGDKSLTYRVYFPLGGKCYKEVIQQVINSSESVLHPACFSVKFASKEEAIQKSAELRNLCVGNSNLILKSEANGPKTLNFPRRIIIIDQNVEDLEQLKKFYNAISVQQILTKKGIKSNKFEFVFESEAKAIEASKKKFKFGYNNYKLESTIEEICEDKVSRSRLKHLDLIKRPAPSKERMKCKNDPDIFCYICGCYTLAHQRLNITNFVRQAYFFYFKMLIKDKKSWAPHTVCKTCVQTLRSWSHGKNSKLKFRIPMVWKKQKNHTNDCYFCLINIKGYNRKNKHCLKYPNLESAIRPIPHSDTSPGPVFNELPEIDDRTSSTLHISSDADEDTKFNSSEISLGNLLLFNQFELNDSVQDLGLSNQSSELPSSLEEKESSTSKVLDNVGDVSEEQGERFHQDIRVMDERD